MEVFIFIALGSLIVYGGFVILKRKKSSKTKVSDLDIRKMKAGGVFQILNVGIDTPEIDVNVIGKHIYRQGNYSWFELEGETGSGKIWLEVEEDDELELSLTLRKMKLQDINITKKELDLIDDKEEGSIQFEGKTYYYDDSDNAEFLRNGDPNKSEKLYYWDFYTEDEKYFIGIEKWSEGSYEVSYGECLNPSQINIFSIE
jgi:hypothetical protein